MNDVIFCAECNKKKYINMLSRIEEFEYSKWVISIRKSKDRQHNGQQKKAKWTNNYLQNITHKTKDRVTRTPLFAPYNYFFYRVIFYSEPEINQGY